LALGGVVVGIVCLLLVAANQQDPLQGQTTDLLSQLTGLRTMCKNRVQSLKGEGIDGAGEYEKAQVEANKFIGYLKGVLDQGAETRRK
jgi:hypothetical protein